MAVHYSVAQPGTPAPEAFARFMIDAFHAAWHAFGGFAYDRYAIKVRRTDDPDGFSLSPVGVSISARDYQAPGIWEFAAHEMFHSWNGKLVRHQPDGTGNLFHRLDPEA